MCRCATFKDDHDKPNIVHVRDHRADSRFVDELPSSSVELYRHSATHGQCGTKSGNIGDLELRCDLQSALEGWFDHHPWRVQIGAIASLTHEKTLVLAWDSSCKADGSYNYVGRNWGFLIRTTTAGTLTVAAPTWTSLTTGDALMGSYGAPRMCSPVKYDGGYLCSTAGSYNDGYGSPIIYWFGDDGTFNPLGIFITAGGRGLDSRVCSISRGR